jgi:hypothetical protein
MTRKFDNAARHQMLEKLKDSPEFALLSEPETSAITGMSVAWHKKDRAKQPHQRRGPRATMLKGGIVRYALGDIKDWVNALRTQGAS